MESIADLLNLVVQPFTLLAAIFISLVSLLIVQRKSHKSSVSNLLLSIALVAIGAVTSAIFSLRYEVKHASPPPVAASADKYHVRIVFRGQTSEELIKFEADSGYIHVGCEQTQQATVVWNVPPGATLNEVTATWVDTNNLTFTNRDITRQSDRVIATGFIRGQSREWLLNCPGGGHGKLVLAGTYRAPRKSVILASAQGILALDGPLRVTIPGTEASSFPITCDIAAEGQLKSADLVLTILRGPRGDLSIADTKRTGNLDINATILPPNQLALRLAQ